MIMKRMVKIFNRLLILEDWTRYHRWVLYVMIVLMISVVYQSWWAYADGTYAVQKERVIEAPISEVWAFVLENENRVRWHAYVTHITKLAGKPDVIGSTRLLDWKSQKGERWTAFEKTDISVPEKRLKVVQNSKRDTRVQDIYLMAESKCKTRVTIRETIYHEDYDKRLLVPFIRFQDKNRLDMSFDALDRWMVKVSPACR